MEETLAAINLPAWPDPDFDGQLFSEVVLRYSQQGLGGDHIELDMIYNGEGTGGVWEKKVGIIPGRNVFYYFVVTLAEPLILETINREALTEALQSPEGTHMQDSATRKYKIEKWAMPDPRKPTTC